MIVKVKEPSLLNGRVCLLIRFCSPIHLAADPDQAAGLMASGCSAIAYETITDDQGGLLLAPMSEVGGAAVCYRGGASESS